MLTTKQLSTPTTTNLSLGGTTRDVTTQIFVTHPTLGQHRTHIKKDFSFQIIYQKVTHVM
jgi:hypothetical protein